MRSAPAPARSVWGGTSAMDPPVRRVLSELDDSTKKPPPPPGSAAHFTPAAASFLARSSAPAGGPAALPRRRVRRLPRPLQPRHRREGWRREGHWRERHWRGPGGGWGAFPPFGGRGRSPAPPLFRRRR